MGRETFKIEGLTFTYFQSTLCLTVQGKETKISIATKIIDEKLLKIMQEDIQEKWSTDKKAIDNADEEDLELTEKEQIIMDRMKTELTKDTADFIQSWNPKRTSLRRKLEKKPRIHPKNNMKEPTDDSDGNGPEPSYTRPISEGSAACLGDTIAVDLEE